MPTRVMSALAVTVIVLLALAGDAAAQETPLRAAAARLARETAPSATAAAAAQRSTPAPRRGKWEVEGHGGGLMPGNPTKGTVGTLPPPAALSTVGGLPSRREPSWFFGDGPVFLNSLPVALSPEKMTSLDLSGLGAEYDSGGMGGFRASLRLTHRLSAEFNFDYANVPLNVTESMLAGIEASRASFENVFNGIIRAASPLFTGDGVRATATTTEGHGHQAITTGAIVIDLMKGGTVPYVTVGAGVITNAGDLPQVTLTGSYAFRFLGIAPIAESDSVHLRYTNGTAFTTLFGGGIKHDVSARWGVRGDVRVHVSGDDTALILDASPTNTPGTPVVVLNSLTSPSIQFSNNQAIAPSTLSGTPVAGFEPFKRDAMQTHLSITGGVYVRF